MMTADELKVAVIKYYTKKNFCIHTEVGVNRRGRLRVDALALSMKGYLVAIEVKSSPRDFLSDKKWQGYLEYCNKFYFCMTNSTFEKVKDKIPKGIGVLIVTHRISVKNTALVGSVRAVQGAKHRDIPEVITRNLIIRMAFRSADHNRFTHRGNK